MKNMKIDANGTEIRVMGDVVNEDAYISLTDIAKYKNPDNTFIVVANWMRNHSTISFLGLREQIHNPNFKPIEFDRFKAESGDNAFTLTPQQWIKFNRCNRYHIKIRSIWWYLCSYGHCF